MEDQSFDSPDTWRGGGLGARTEGGDVDGRLPYFGDNGALRPWIRGSTRLA